MKDHPLRGILYMNAAIFLIAATNVFAKYLSDDYSPIEVVFYRSVIGIMVISAIIQFFVRKPELFKTDRLRAQVFRGLCGTVGITSMFFAYSLMPMAEATAILFTGGLFTPILAILLLNEKVGPYRWAAIIIGIGGALLIVMPEGTNINTMGVLAALTAALVGGGFVSIMLRSLGKTENALTTSFYFLLIGCLATSPYMVMNGHLPTTENAIFFLILGCMSLSSLLFKTQAYRYAEVSMLSPLTYIMIVWATLFGWMIWDDWPTWNVFAGAAIVITGNIIIILREKRKKDAIPCE